MSPPHISHYSIMLDKSGNSFPKVTARVKQPWGRMSQGFMMSPVISAAALSFISASWLAFSFVCPLMYFLAVIFTDSRKLVFHVLDYTSFFLFSLAYCFVINADRFFRCQREAVKQEFSSGKREQHSMQEQAEIIDKVPWLYFFLTITIFSLSFCAPS